VGMVEGLDLSRDLTHVEVHGRVRRDLKDHLTSGVRFCRAAAAGRGRRVRPGDAFSGVYIEMEPDRAGPARCSRAWRSPRCSRPRAREDLRPPGEEPRVAEPRLAGVLPGCRWARRLGRRWPPTGAASR
jgi:hypothetical protein